MNILVEDCGLKVIDCGLKVMRAQTMNIIGCLKGESFSIEVLYKALK